MTSLQDFADDIQDDTVGTLRPKLAMLAHRDVLTEVAEERARQDAKWGEKNHPDGTGPEARPLRAIGELLLGYSMAVSAPKLAAAGRRACQDNGSPENPDTWTAILLEEVFEALAEEDPAKLRAELVQVAAVAVAWAEAIDRRPAA